MIKTLALAAAAMTLLAAPAHAGQDRSGAEKLARMLEGRVAGEPVTCITTHRIHDSTIIDGTAIVYEIGDTLYVNTTRDPETLDDDDRLVVRTLGTRLCSYNPVTTFNRHHDYFSGTLQLSEFVPYKRIG